MSKTTLNIVPINSVVFPLQTIRLFIPSSSIYFKKNLIGSTLGVCFQKNPSKKFSLVSYLTDIGIVIKVTDEITETNPGTKKPYKTIRGAALRRFRVKGFPKLNPYSAEVELLPDEVAINQDEIGLDSESVNKLKTLGSQYVEQISYSDGIIKTRLEFIRSEGNLTKVHYAIASYLSIADEEKCKLLEISTVKDRIVKIIQILEDLLARQKNSEKITFTTKHSNPTGDKEAGSNSTNAQPDELEVLLKKLLRAGLPDQIRESMLREFNRLRQMDTSNHEYLPQKKYLETVADLPWSRSSDESYDIDLAEKVLNRDHAGLEIVKKRILEFIAVRMLKKNSKGAILCLQGPPGIGKTSLGKSIAEALGRSFARVALGGVRDEAEIRGHRRTYVGAMPGVFIDAVMKSKTNNPVILLDEIDKVGGGDSHSDTSAALLEVLDPNQNQTFQDHYLGVPFDLSKVLFIATANSLDTIKTPLLDRMEVISLTGYTLYEKVRIARDYLLPKQIKENGIEPRCIKFTEEAIGYVINHYTSEAGVRNLERTIGSLCRKVAFSFLKTKQQQDKSDFNCVEISEQFIEKVLGPKAYDEDIKQRISQPGIVIGLAWTSVGGKTLLVEASKAEGKGGIQITGQLGDVMRESVLTALGWIKSHWEIVYLIASKAQLISNRPEDKININDYDIHIHFPAAAIPKDGPSAGITITLALISLLTEVKVRDDIAMTGEVSLKGNVLPVGGIKEKCLAAYSHKINHVILPEQNQKNVEEIPKEVRENMNFHFVKYVEEILPLALTVSISKEEIESVLKYSSKQIHQQSML